MDYIIIQAGGRGSRLETLTINKPKCLVAVDNLPIIFHLFKLYPHAKYKIIADYKADVLEKYLQVFAKKDVDYEIIVTNEKGTCSGISKAASLIPDKNPVMLIWCDLILFKPVLLPDEIKENYIGISKTFMCRWSYSQNKFEKIASKEDGVAGLFIFSDKSFLDKTPKEGEFVAHLQELNSKFSRLDLEFTKEIGTMLSYSQNESDKPRSRPFNKHIFDQDIVEKIPLDDQGKKLAANEIAWYQKVKDLDFDDIPEIYNLSPLRMERIKGKNVFDYFSFNHYQKKSILGKIIDVLSRLHNLLPEIPANQNCCRENYINKTFERLESVKNLVPFANDPEIIINNKKYQNVFFVKEKLIKKIESILPEKFFLIHGDPTFSNILIKDETISPILIDPRGYFGNTKLYGDKNYDWAKLYYSIVGNYDQFNLKRFALTIDEKDVELEINSNGWEKLEETFFALTKADPKTIKLLHAIIWLSLTTYAWEDYDSICGAFYNGIIYLNEIL